MKYHWRYFKYLMKHKWYVFIAGRKLGVSPLALIVHDLSKFGPAEWFPYVNKLFSDYTGEYINYEFRVAVNHHYHNNPHHWEYWVFKGYPLVMPAKYMKEMVADWMGAGRAIKGSWDIKEWYEANKGSINIHPIVRKEVELLISITAFDKPAPSR